MSFVCVRGTCRRPSSRESVVFEITIRDNNMHIYIYINSILYSRAGVVVVGKRSARVQVGRALYAGDDYKQLLLRTRECPRRRCHHHPTGHWHWTAGGVAPDSIGTRRRFCFRSAKKYVKTERRRPLPQTYRRRPETRFIIMLYFDLFCK